MREVIIEYDGLTEFLALQNVRNDRREMYEFLYGVFLLEYGRWEKLNGVWVEHWIDINKARYHLQKAMRRTKEVAFVEYAIGESYYRQGMYYFASFHFSKAWDKDYEFEFSFWALMETLYMHGRYKEVAEKYCKFKKLKVTYSKNLENWIELLLCYASLHYQDVESVIERLPLLSHSSEETKCEDDIYTLYVFGLMIYVNSEKKHDAYKINDKVFNMKYLSVPWLNMLQSGITDMSAVRESIIENFCPAGVFSHLLPLGKFSVKTIVRPQ